MNSENEPDSHVIQVQELFIKHQPTVRGFIFAMIPDFSATDDLLQETFLLVTRKAHSFELGTSFLAWVRRIVRYKVLETLRQNTRQSSYLSFSEEVVEALFAHQENLPEEKEDAESGLRHLEKCLSKLAPQARKAIELRYGQGHRLPEIARQLGCTIPSANVTLSRARAFLRNCVDQQKTAAP